MLRKSLIFLLPWILLGVCTLFLWNQFKKKISLENDKTVISHQIIIEKVEALGKLELVKFFVKDIVEHTVIKQWWPDPKVILLVSGEVVGCIDLKKMDSTDIEFRGETIILHLPEPEICYSKINHQESKVYHLENELFDQAGLVDKAYQVAEKQLQQSAIKMKILEQTRSNAMNMLKPFVESISGKKVFFAPYIAPKN